MSQRSRNRPRGLNFLLGGTLVAAAFVLFAILAGPIEFGGFGAPEVRIDDPIGAASAAGM